MDSVRSGRTETARFSAMQFLFWASIVCFEAFLVPYLTDAGYSPSRVGLVMSAIFGFSIVGQPLLGSLSDRLHSPRWIVAAAMAVAGGGSLLLPRATGVYIAVVAVALLYSLSANSLPAVIDAWIMDRRRRNPAVSYGIARGFGSLGFAAGAFVFGRIAERFGIPVVFPSYAGLALAVALIALLMPRGGRPHPPETTPAAAGRAHLSEGLRAVASNGPYLALLAGTFTAFIGYRAAMTFLPLLLSAVGGSVADVGTAHSIAALSEAPLLFVSGILIRRLRGPKLITGVLLLMAVRLFSYSLAGSAQMVLLLQISHGVTFGIFLAAVVDYIDVIAPPPHRALFQAIAPSVFFGLGSVVGSWVGGLLIEALSLTRLYEISAAFTLSGALIVAAAGWLRARRPPAARPAEGGGHA